MNPQRTLVAIGLLEAATQALSHAGIRHAALHGLEGLPEKAGRDVDIMLDPMREAEALEILAIAFSRKQVPFYRHYNPVGTQQFLFQIAPGEDAAAGFEIDFLTRLHLRWGPVIFTSIHDPIRPSNIIAGLPFSPWGSFVKRLLVKALAGHWKTISRKRHDWHIDEQDKDLIRVRLSHFVGSGCAEDMLAALTAGDLPALQKVQPRMRSSLYRRPFITPKGWAAWLAEEWNPWLRAGQGTPILAIVGPDGVGKSTVINLLEQKIREQTSFPNVKIKHWRPGLLPQLGRMKGVRPPEPGQAAIPRKRAGSFGAVRQIYYTLDFLLGYWLIDRLEGNRLTALIYDRCLLDMIVHPVRFGFTETGLVRVVASRCVRPDMIVHLKDDPRQIHARKDELSVPEIERQFSDWAKLARAGHVDLVVDVAAGPEPTAQAIMRYFTTHVEPVRRLYGKLPDLNSQPSSH